MFFVCVDNQKDYIYPFSKFPLKWVNIFLELKLSQFGMTVTKAILGKWMAAQKRLILSARHVQMACELGLNPDKLGKINNHRGHLFQEILA